MEDFYYRVYTEQGRFATEKRDVAFDYYANNAGSKIETVTKDLFPTVTTIIEDTDFNLERIRKDLTIKKTSEALRKAVDKYDKEHTKSYLIKLNCSTDKDIIDYLESLSNKQGFIKELIREHIKNGKHY